MQNTRSNYLCHTNKGKKQADIFASWIKRHRNRYRQNHLNDTLTNKDTVYKLYIAYKRPTDACSQYYQIIGQNTTGTSLLLVTTNPPLVRNCSVQCNMECLWIVVVGALQTATADTCSTTLAVVSYVCTNNCTGKAGCWTTAGMGDFQHEKRC